MDALPLISNDEAVIIPEALILLISNPSECKFWVWNWRPWVCPNVNAVPTLIKLLSPSIVVELEPNVTTPTNVACPFDSIVAPVPTLILLTIISSWSVSATLPVRP